MQRRIRKVTNQPFLMPNVNIVLLGKTGSGKSASANTIIGGDRRPFDEGFSASSVTRVCRSAQTVVDGQTITVIDTVGLPDTLQTIADVQTRIEQIFDCECHGVDVFLLVIKLGQTFTEESRKVVKWIQNNFGAKLLRHTLVLFTHGDQLHVPIETYLSTCEPLLSVVDQCSGGFHIFNNRNEDRSQVTELLDKINTLRDNNRNSRYTKQVYRKTQDEILQNTTRAVRERVLEEAVRGGVVGGGVGAVGGAIAAKVGVVALTVGKAAVIGATGGAVLVAGLVCGGVYFFF